MLRRPNIKGEVAERVSEQVYDFIAHNPTHQVPTKIIGAKYAVAPNQVTTIIRQLLAAGKIKRRSRYTYEVVGGGVVPKQTRLVTTKPVVKPAQPNALLPFAEQVAAEAKNFKWESDSDSLRKFVDWLTEKY